jgi:hypothetical protein
MFKTVVSYYTFELKTTGGAISNFAINEYKQPIGKHRRLKLKS